MLATSAFAGSAAIGLTTFVRAERLDAANPQAKALGYVHSGAQVDRAKYPKFETSQHCANCALYQGAASDARGGCAIVPGKQVNAKGWCSAWVKKA